MAILALRSSFCEPKDEVTDRPCSTTLFSSYSLQLFAQTQSELPRPATQADLKAVPVFVDGQAQIVPGFNIPQTWIKSDLWVETEFDIDGDGKKDRMHVDVTRPPQTENGLKLPVLYESSPYFAGTSGNAPQTFWNIEQEVDSPPVPRQHAREIRPRTGHVISNDLVNEWVRRGICRRSLPMRRVRAFHKGIPTVGGDPECPGSQKP